MRKNLLFLLVLVMLPLVSNPVNATPIAINLQVQYIDPTHNQDNPNRTPMNVPEVSIENFTLYFATPCDGYTLILINEDGEVEYTSIIPTSNTTLHLPFTLDGNYEILILNDNLCFYGYIML